MIPRHLDKFTLQRLEVLLKQTKNKNDLCLEQIRKQLLSSTFFEKQQTNAIHDILRYVHVNSYAYEEIFPSYVVSFLQMKSKGRINKLHLVEQYSGMLSLSHSMFQLTDKDNNKLIKNYRRLWKESQLNFYKNQYPYEQKYLESCDDESIAQLTLHKNVNPDAKRLAQLKKKYNALDLKLKPPDLEVIIHPDRFGEPPVPQRVFNMQVSRIVKLQQYFKKNRPVKFSTLEYFHKLDLSSLDGTVREAYFTFVNDIFSITETDLVASKCLDNSLKMSEKLRNLYTEFSKE